MTSKALLQEADVNVRLLLLDVALVFGNDGGLGARWSARLSRLAFFLYGHSCWRRNRVFVCMGIFLLEDASARYFAIVVISCGLST